MVGRKGSTVPLGSLSPTVQTHGRRDTFNELTLPSVLPTAPPVNPNKPPYRVPSMPEIAALPWNGLTVASTFSGCGGSSLGYKMAGYKVLWANEFIPAAQDTYRANHHGTILNTADIRKVSAAQMLKEMGLEEGELDILDGSPPCAAFSTAGKREAGWGKVKAYSDTHQRVDDLFFEYIRLIRGVRPKVFVAENVSGLVKGTAKGYFLEILREMKASGYRVRCKVLDAQWLGVPQQRQRTIFIGVREDLEREVEYPKPLGYYYTVADALPNILAVGDNGGFGGGAMRSAASAASAAIGASPQAGNGRFPPSIVRAYRDDRGAFGNGGDITDQPSPTILSDSVGTHWMVEAANGLAPGPDGHHAMLPLDGKPFPTVQASRPEQVAMPVPSAPEPESDMTRYAVGREWDKLKPGESTYYGGRLWKPDPALPSLTVTQRGGDGSVASVTHPTERRKFTIAELRRICAFPDDFILTGTYAQQWERLGRAVPPVMMYHVAAVIRDSVFQGGAGHDHTATAE